jgi:uncharacterized protein YodC (DUF2158 family)
MNTPRQIVPGDAVTLKLPDNDQQILHVVKKTSDGLLECHWIDSTGHPQQDAYHPNSLLLRHEEYDTSDLIAAIRCREDFRGVLIVLSPISGNEPQILNCIHKPVTREEATKWLPGLLKTEAESFP